MHIYHLQHFAVGSINVISDILWRMSCFCFTILFVLLFCICYCGLFLKTGDSKVQMEGLCWMANISAVKCWVCVVAVLVNAWQLEWMYLSQHQVPSAGQCHEAGPCWTQRRSFRFSTCHWCPRIIWYVIVAFCQVVDFSDQKLCVSHSFKCFIHDKGLFRLFIDEWENSLVWLW